MITLDSTIATDVIRDYNRKQQQPTEIRGFKFYYDHENEGVIVIPPDNSYIKFTKNSWYD